MLTKSRHALSIVCVIAGVAWLFAVRRAAPEEKLPGVAEKFPESSAVPPAVIEMTWQQVPTIDARLSTPRAQPDEVALDAATLETLALEVGGSSLTVAAEWLRRLPVSEGRNQALAAVMARLSTRDPGAAVSWASNLRPDDGQAGILISVFGEWLGRAPVAASRWLSENEGHPFADLLICQLASHPSVIATSPVLALQWSALLEEPEARQQQMETILVEWGRRDLVGASAYIRRVDFLDASEKRRLIDHLVRTEKNRG